MESSQDPGLTSYLKSMFVQFNGEEPSPPPVPAARTPKGSLTEEDPSLPIDLNNNESHAKSPPAASPASSSSAPLPNGSIKVDVIVHNDATNSVANSELNGHKEDIERHEDSLAALQQNSSSAEAHSQPTVDGSKIALSFLDELKHTLQVNKPLSEEAPEEPGQQQLKSGSEQHKEPLGQQNGTNEQDEEAAGRREEVAEAPSVSHSPPPAPLTNSYPNSVQDDEGSANEEVSVESGINIDEDLDDQSSIASETTTVQFQPPEPLSPSRQVLTRSASSDLNGSAPTRRVMMRSVSQDVKFKLESIREEKKVTKSHVSELANFWKGKMISPKEKN